MTKSAFSTQNRRRRIRIVIISASFLLIIFIAYLALSRGVDLIQQRTTTGADNEVSAEALWNEGRYASLTEVAEEYLLSKPLNRDALLFAGYARYYLAISRNSIEEQSVDLNYAIRHLRLLLARGGTPDPGKVKYMLGKSYLIKGKYWADLAVHYLSSSLKEGYEPDDIYEYLGRAYSSMGEYETALKWCLKALEEYPTERLLLSIGEQSFNLGRYDDAASYYLQAIDKSRDDSLKKRGLFQLGQLYYDVGNYDQAMETLKQIENMDISNEEYLFLYAEVLYKKGRNHEAKRYWQRVLRINPGHSGALKRLYN